MSEKKTKDGRQGVRFNTHKLEVLQRNGWSLQSLIDWAIDEKFSKINRKDYFKEFMTEEKLKTFISNLNTCIDLGFTLKNINKETVEEEGFAEAVYDILEENYILTEGKTFVELEGPTLNGSSSELKVYFDV